MVRLALIFSPLPIPAMAFATQDVTLLPIALVACIVGAFISVSEFERLWHVHKVWSYTKGEVKP